MVDVVAKIDFRKVTKKTCFLWEYMLELNK